MRILVTGSRGQVGSELIERLGKDPMVSEVLATSSESLDFTLRESVLDAMKTFSPSVVIHCGAMTNVDRCEDEVDRAYLVNALGTRYLKQAARLVGAKMLYLSTDYVFNGASHEPIREWSRTDPLSVYGASKLAGEMELDSGDLIVRTSWVMGRNGKNILKTILGLAKGTDTVRFVDDQIGSPTVVSDLVTTIVALVRNRDSGIFHVTNSGSTSWYDLTRFVFEYVGAPGDRVLAIKSSDLDSSRKAPRPAYSVLDNSALRLGGYPEMPNWQESISHLCDALTRNA